MAMFDDIPTMEQSAAPVAQQTTETAGAEPAASAPPAQPAETTPETESAPAAETAVKADGPGADGPVEAGPETAPGAQPESGAAEQAVQESAPDAPESAPSATAPDAAVTAALLAAAKALGISETDPAKIPAAIEARETAARAAQEAQRELAVQQRINQAAGQEVADMLDPAVRAALAADGVYVPDGFDWFRGPEADQELLATYTAKQSELYAQPEWRQRHSALVQAGQTAHAEQQAQLAKMLDQYPDQASDLVATFRDLGANSALLTEIARQTHERVAKATLTLNSRALSLEAENAALKATISGHAAAIEAAKTEGRNAVITTLSAGETNPVTPGTGSPSREQRPDASKFQDPYKAFTLDNIPLATQ